MTSMPIGRRAPRSSRARGLVAVGRTDIRRVVRRQDGHRDQGNRGQRSGGEEWRLETEGTEQGQAERGHRELPQRRHHVVDPRRLAAASGRCEATDHRMAAAVERCPGCAVNDAVHEQRQEPRDEVRDAAESNGYRAAGQDAGRAPLVDEAAHPRPKHDGRQAERGHDQADESGVAAPIHDEQRQDRLDDELRREAQEGDDAQGEERLGEQGAARSRGGNGRGLAHEERAAVISSATASIMSSWPPTTRRRPSSTSRSRASTS